MTAKQALQVDYHMMLTGSPDTVVLLDIDSGMLCDANANALALFGLSEHELMSRRLAELCPPLQPDGTPSCDTLADAFAQVLGGAVRSFALQVMQAQVHQLACEMHLVPLPIPGRKLMHVRLVDVTQKNKDDILRIGQGRLLEMIARGAPLSDTLDELMLLVESQSDGLYCSVLLLDDDRQRILAGSGPSLPAALMTGLNGFPIGPSAGSCGTAIYRKDTVIVTDIMADPLWDGYRALAAPYGFRACWSTPIYLNRDHLLGSFAMYYKEVRSPCADDMRLVAVATHLAGIAIERTRREGELAQHRDQLEVLVTARTAELTTALATLSMTQAELVRRDKLAALGSLVAGVAHELNTPLGNSLVVATTMAEHARALEGSVAHGLRRSNLERYLAQAHEASDILIRNLHRAAGLVASFKQLAVDQASSQRRDFSLSELLAELVLPLRIAIRARPLRVELAIDPELRLDSYPGPLAQVLGSLFDNCLLHAFDGESSGTIRIAAHQRAPGLLELIIADSGTGMSAANAAKVYDPFFTTKLGSGGSGLGLHVAHNIVTGVLGGSISLTTTPGQGSTFTLLLPAVAPALQGGPEHA